MSVCRLRSAVLLCAPLHYKPKDTERLVMTLSEGALYYDCRCIMSLMSLAILALIVVIVLKVLHIGQPKTQAQNALKSLAVRMTCCTDKSSSMHMHVVTVAKSELRVGAPRVPDH